MSSRLPNWLLGLLTVICATLLLFVGLWRLAGRERASGGRPWVERLPGNPIITPEMLPGDDGNNIDGPSLIRVPEWVPQPLGKYYLYFAHHRGRYIRLAYAQQLTGPWMVYQPGTLRLEDTVCDSVTNPQVRKHVASPDVHVDDAARQIRMYFHCPAYVSGPPQNRQSYQQITLAATSQDGLHFEAGTEYLGDSYFRVFRWQDAHYALAMPGIFYRSVDGLHGFEQGPKLFSDAMRHSAVLVQGDTMLVFYSNIGDDPESILMSKIELSPDWLEWRESESVVVLRPEEEWEGADLPRLPSERAEAFGPVHQLRDPAVFEEEGRTYLLYSVAGESGIAIAEILFPEED